jgi:hypothetical protein
MTLIADAAASTFTVRTAGDVDILTQPGARRIKRVVVESPHITGARGAAISAAYERLAGECGCHAGAVTMAAATVCYVGFAFTGDPSRSAARLIGGGIAVMIGAAVVGKLLGIAVARVRLHLLIRQLRSEISEATNLSVANDAGRLESTLKCNSH